MKTILSHFYNEEYILPWWLNHHKKYFDHGILIDYHSTDNSINIIKNICPKWDIIKSKNLKFGAREVDDEIKFYESKINGWKICLNVTEFLYGDYSLLAENSLPEQFMIPSLFFVDNPNVEFALTRYDIPLHKQILTGLPNASIDNVFKRCFRSLHNFNVDYPLGRHFWPKNSIFGDHLGGAYEWKEQKQFENEHPLDVVRNSKFMIFYYGFAPYNKKVIDRKLQIQYKIPKNDIDVGFGFHHLLNRENLQKIWKNNYNDCVDLRDMISLYTDKKEMNNDWSKFRNIDFISTDTTNIISELCKISLEYNSDKCPYIDLEKSISGHRHPYTPTYDLLFSNLREIDINFLEIGIGNNDSINIWRKYFKSAKIYGLEYCEDRLNFAKKQNLKNVEYEFVNVWDEKSLSSTFRKLNTKYDIIIEDSTHQFDDQIRIIKNVTDYIKPGGILVIEDIFRSENPYRYINDLFHYLKYFSSIQFIETEHEMKVSTGWDNDKLLVMIRNNLPFEFSKSHDFIKEEDISDIKKVLLFNNTPKVFIVTPSRRPFNLTFIEKTIPQECEWIVVFDKTVKNEHIVENATVIKSQDTGFWGNPNRNIGLEYIKNQLNPSDNDWVYILDDDNVIHPEWWNNIQSHLNTDASIITWGQLWASGEPRTEPTDTPKIAKIDTSQYMVRWNVAKNLRFEHIYEADGIYAEEASKLGSVKKLDQYLGYYNFLRKNKTGKSSPPNICMISMFKNESKGIRRMLESVYKHIDFYVFQDNGSTDGTPDIVKEFFADKKIPGFIYNVEEGWVGFGWNRDHLLQTTLRNDHGCDWIMKMDCDEYLEVDDDFDWSPFYNTNTESFHVTAQNPGCIYYRAWIWNAKLPWKFKHDVAHECIYLDNEKGENFERINLPRGLRMIGTNDGESYEVRTKYITDALKLEEKLIREETMLTDTYHFWYVAKSYMDCYGGDFYPLKEAHSKEFTRRYIFYFEEYLKHVNVSGIHEMSYFSAFSIGLGHKYLGNYEKAIEWFNAAEKYCPVRNEHIVHLALTYDELKQYDKMLEQTIKLISPERKLPFPEYYFLLDSNIYYDSGDYPQYLHNYTLSKVNEEKSINSFSINITTKPRLWIVDDFYADPYAVREFALKQEFESNLDFYKGSRTKEQYIIPGTKEAFEKIIGKKITNWTETHGMCGRLQYCTAEDALVYHCDGQTLAGMVYLTPDADFSCGTSLYAHKRTGLRNENDFKDINVFEGGYYDKSKFELVDTAGNVFNRLVLFDAKCIHSANEYFGTNINNSRLFHLFFFD